MIRELFAAIGLKVDQKSVSAADKAIEGLKSKLTSLVGAYLGFRGLEYIKDKFTGIANTATELTTLAQKTGMSTQALQELSYAAEQTNVDAGELRMGLVHLQRSAFEASTQGGQTGAAFKRLGIEVTGADGKLRPTNDLLGMVADKFASMPDGAQKTALAMALLGRSGAQLIPVFNGGSAGIAKWGKEARATGGLMSEGLIKRGVELRHGLLRLQYVVQGLTYAILGPFVRSVTAGKNSLASWIAVHRQIISLRVQEVVSVIAGAFQLAARGAAALGSALIPLAAVLFTILFPLTAISAALIFLANDFNRYLDGKDSIIGRLVYAFNELLKSMGIDDFMAKPIENSKKLFLVFFDWLVEQAALIPDRIARAIGAKKMQQWSKFIFEDLGLDFTKLALPDGSQAALDFDRANQPAFSAFNGFPGSRFSQLQQQAAQYLPGRGQTITFGDITIHASDAEGGTAAADAFIKRVDERIDLRLSESDPGRD